MAEGYRFAPTTNDLSRPSDLRLHYEEGGPSLQRGIRVNAVLRLDIGVASGNRRSLREIRPNPELTAMLRIASSRLGDLNPGPTHYECVALPLS